MEDDNDNTTTDDQSVDRLSNPGSCKFILDIHPRKVPKTLVESQMARLTVLKKKTHDLKIENEVLRAENSALKKNIERYYDLVIKARETKKPKGSSSISSATLCVGIILACTVHLNLESDSVSLGERRLMTIVILKMLILLLLPVLSINITYIPGIRTPPSERILPVMDYNPPSNSLYIFGGYANGVFLNDFWTFSLKDMIWTKYMPIGSAIGGFASKTLQKFFIFGGISSTGILNDFWEFDVKTQTWTELQTLNPPSNRHSFAYLTEMQGNNQLFYVFGGRLMEEVDNNLFRLNLSTLEWALLPLNGEVPRLYNCNIIKYQKFIYLVGGANNSHFNTSSGGLYRYDLEKLKWENVYQKDFDNKIMRSTYTRNELAGCLLQDSFLHLALGVDVELNRNIKSVFKVDLNDPDFKWTVFLDEIFEGGGGDSFASAQKGNIFYGFAGFLGINKTLGNALLSLDLTTGTANIIVMSQKYLAPKSRSFHSMNLVNGKFYIFGGIDDNQYFNDVLVFDPNLDIWTTIDTIGSIPSGRFAFACASQGDAIAVWGGQDFIGLKNDFYIFKVFSNTWERFIPSSIEIPTAAKGACLALDIPDVYIYGGETSSGLSNSFYRFNILTNIYEKLESDNYVAYATCEFNSTLKFFYVIFGRTVNTLVSRNVRYCNVSSGEWDDYFTVQEDAFLTSQGVTLLIDKGVIVIGGQLWDVYPYNTVYYYSDNSYQLLGHISEYPYRAAFAYYKDSFYIFGGGEVVGQSLRSAVSINRMYSISIGQICKNDKCKVFCSKGTTSNSSHCTLCQKGSYSVGVSNSSCDLCEIGTYNPFIGATSPRQCYPCPVNSYNDLTGQGFCVDCLNGYSCPPGSVYPVDLLRTADSGSIQPKLFERPDISHKIFSFLISVGLIMSFFFVVIVSFEKLRKILTKIDTFTNLHNYIIGRVMLLRATFIGGVATLIFICIAIIILGITIINYTEDNITESKTLVPKVVLDQEVDEFKAAEVNLVVEFMRYGGKCSDISFNYGNMKCKYETFHKEKNSKDRTCRIEIVFTDLIINSGATVTLVTNEQFSYCSGINVNLTSSSSLPNEISSIWMNLSPEGNKVFVGPEASIFSFTVTPSLFKSVKKSGKTTGYHISSELVPKAGSQFVTSELSIISQLSLVIVLTLSNSGLYTFRYYEQTFIYVASALIGSIFGIMGAIGGVMKFIEKNYWRFCRIRKKKLKLDAIDSKRNWVEKHFETQVDGRVEDREDMGKSFRLDIDF